MHTYWTIINIEPGTAIRVTIQADSPYAACQMLRAQWGDKFSGSVGC